MERKKKNKPDRNTFRHPELLRIQSDLAKKKNVMSVSDSKIQIQDGKRKSSLRDWLK